MLAPQTGAPASNGRVPSHYQEAIYAFVRSGEGHGVVDAVPGSGKTTTLVEACNRVDAVLAAHFLAFNRHALVRPASSGA